MKATRREFLESGAAAAATLLAPSMLHGAEKKPAKAIVVLQLAGGNDSLATLVPFTDARYRVLRGTLAVPERDLLPIHERFAFHPSLAQLVPLFERGKLAIIDGVGFPSLDRSHFRAQDVWQTADEECGRDRRRRAGWIGRYAEHYLASAGPLVTLAIGTRAPLGMQHDSRPPAVIADPSRFTLPRGADAEELEAIRELYAIRRTRDATSETIRAWGKEMFHALDSHERTPLRSSGVVYPSTRLAQSLRGVASLLDAHPGARFAWVTTGSYDTHAAQRDAHANLLSDLAAALASFQADLEARRIEDRVLLMAWSEFGRRAAENASGGTDHGKAGLVFVSGSGVKGGLWGASPDLARLDDGDLPSRVDFRSVYATLIERWLGGDAVPILGRRWPLLGFA
jgi:uncharacterized protein (DUF1501 family)